MSNKNILILLLANISVFDQNNENFNDVSIQTLTLTGSRINFSGTNLDFYTPVQAQYNGNKPLISMSQYGEINFFSTPFMQLPYKGFKPL